MSRWRIELATTNRSTCRYCSKRIEAGEQRFGQDERGADWFHLACAPRGKPLVWKNFSPSASALSKPSAPAPTNGTKATSAIPSSAIPSSTRNPELEARLVASPDDDEVRAVFADWLMDRGDPWGELIALDRAGSPKVAAHMKSHARALMGSFAPKMFEWRRGFVHRVELGVLKVPQASQTIEELLALRTVFLVRDLRIPVGLELDLARILSTGARALSSLFCWWGRGLGALALPSLTTLSVFVATAPRDVASLAPFFAAKALPSLSELEIFNRVLPVDFIDALLASPMLAQLRSLTLSQRTLDLAGADRIAEHPHALAHLTHFKLDVPPPRRERLASVFGPRLVMTGR